MPQQLTMKRSGFSLIELLVVIVIIGLLVAMLMPSLTSARKSARSVQCLSQLRQLSIAHESYADAANDQYPDRSGSLWPTRLADHGLTLELIICPEDEDPTAGELTHSFPEYRLSRSYVINGFNDYFVIALGLGSDDSVSFHGLSMPRHAVKQPSATLALAGKRSGSDHLYVDLLESGGDDLNEIEYQRHAVRSGNHAYLDGAARSVAFPDTLFPENQWGVTGPGRGLITDPGNRRPGEPKASARRS